MEKTLANIIQESELRYFYKSDSEEGFEETQEATLIKNVDESTRKVKYGLRFFYKMDNYAWVLSKQDYLDLVKIFNVYQLTEEWNRIDADVKQYRTELDSMQIWQIRQCFDPFTDIVLEDVLNSAKVAKELTDKNNKKIMPLDVLV